MHYHQFLRDSHDPFYIQLLAEYDDAKAQIENLTRCNDNQRNTIDSLAAESIRLRIRIADLNSDLRARDGFRELHTNQCNTIKGYQERETALRVANTQLQERNDRQLNFYKRYLEACGLLRRFHATERVLDNQKYKDLSDFLTNLPVSNCDYVPRAQYDALKTKYNLQGQTNESLNERWQRAQVSNQALRAELDCFVCVQ